MFQTCVNMVMPSQLTVEQPIAAPFSTLEQFLKSDFHLQGTAALQEPLQNSKDPHLRFLGARMVPFPPIDEAFVQSRIARPPQERIAYLIPPPSYATLAKYSCDYVVAIPKVFSTRTAPFWFRRDSQLFDKFSHKYAWAASGATILHNSPQFSII